MRPGFFALIVSLLVLTAGQAFAHAHLDHTVPGADETVASAPGEITLWFTQKLEPAFSTVTITNAAGERVDTGKPRIDGSQMVVSLRAGGAGIYRVTWHAVSLDTHITDGNYTFTVGP